MKTLYFECNMGAAGDMLMASLIELLDEPQQFVERFNKLGIPDVTLTVEKSQKCGITGTHARILIGGEEENEHMHEHHHEHHHHSGMADIEHIISHLEVSDAVKDNAIAVYKLIAEAESHVHGHEIEHIHFHEVGTMDAIADVVGVCMLIDEIKPDRILSSPIHVGAGQVKCAHGILPVPAPATAYILRDVPIYGGEVKGELCTPTGAALLAHFTDEFSAMPVMKTEKIGYGMGTKDFETANCLRVLLGETSGKAGEITELRCNIDDMTGEQIGFAVEELFANGALDVYTIPISMKKNRPGILLTVMCKAEQKDEMLSLIFRHTTTLGIREYTPKRYTLKRSKITLKTPYGDVRGKKSEGYETVTVKAEYEDLARIARENNISIKNIKCEEDN